MLLAVQDIVPKDPVEVITTAEEVLDVEPGVISKFLTELPSHILRLGVRVLLAFVIFIVGQQLIRLLTGVIRRSMERAGTNRDVRSFTLSFVRYGSYILLILLIAAGVGIDATSIMALVGSAGVTVGLALQGSLSNLVGGILILVMNPFSIGDYIREDSHGNEGTVTDIHIFYTKLLTADQKQVVLPNGDLANTSLTNYSTMPTRRLDIPVGISYTADVAKAREVLLDMLDKDGMVLDLADKQPVVFVDELGDSAVKLILRFFVPTSDYWEARYRFPELIKKTLDENGISIPYPQLDVYIKER
ncbi:MAG: mechanosensitive ion channel family protein [Lachnospiraceae bacterium]|nr:mechanosensitive ion channel family protein [Lachnospiraceae bacterium]